MVKKPTSDLRTSCLSLNVHKYNISELQKEAEKDWGIYNLQPFFPSLEKLFKINELESPLQYGLQLTDEIQSIITSNTIRTSTGIKSVHKKISMILSPFGMIKEEYGKIGLPSTFQQGYELSQKIQNPNNAVYIGALFSALLSESECPNFPKVYGIFSGTALKHTIDISDDYEELSERPWFSQNIGKTFHLKISDHVQNSPNFKHTRTAKIDLEVGEDTILEDIEEIHVDPIHAEPADLQVIFKQSNEDEEMSDSSSVSTSFFYDIESCKCESDDGSEIEDEEDDEPFAWATFSNVPVQITVMEPCDGTFYTLCMANPDTQKHADWMAQVVFALAFAQRNFGFVHNDLHANNVMYVSTTKEFLYYNISGKFYKVPTHGYIIKIIDFERGTGSVKLQGMKEPKFFMSDHFAPNEEARGQYNTEPYYCNKFPSVKPNPSFDLCRFATSMFWDLFPEGPKHEAYQENILFKLFIKWMSTEDGKSILFRYDNSRHDRYHSFNQYKAIARYCKSAIPKKDIEYFKSFLVKSVPVDEHTCSIEN